MRIRRMRSYTSRLFHIVGERNFWLTTLGKTGRQFIWLVKTFDEVNKKVPNLLIAAGFHGEEIAGPYAILKFLEDAKDCYFNKVNLSFLPVVNPVGFNRGTRYARAKQKTNCGFCHVKGDKLAVEGKILKANIDGLRLLGKGGFLSLHEDDTTTKFYVYDHSPKPDGFARCMRDEEAKYFDPLPDGGYIHEESDPSAVVMDGMVIGLHDGSFEDYMSQEGAEHSIVTETPAQGIALDRRVEAGAALIKRFIDLTVRKL